MDSTNINNTGATASRREAMAPHSAARLSKRLLGPRKVAVAALATALLLGTTACGASSAGSQAAGQGTTASPAATATASAKSTSTAPAAPSSTGPAAASGAWRTFTSADGKVSFEYPAAWRVSTLAGPAGGPDIEVGVSDAAGIGLASLHYGPSGAGLGGGCQNPVPYSVLDSMELALPYNTAGADTIPPRFVFRALQEADRVTASYGITGSVAGKDGTSCMVYNVVSGPAESPFYYFADTLEVRSGSSEQNGNRKGAKTFASLDEARAYMQTPEYMNAKRMITSLKLKAG